MQKKLIFVLAGILVLATLVFALNNEHTKTQIKEVQLNILEGKTQAASFLPLKKQGGVNAVYSCNLNSDNGVDGAKTNSLSPQCFTCPAKTGTCIAGTYACDQDLGNPPAYRACEYECVGGTYSAGTECSQNMCYGGRCL